MRNFNKLSSVVFRLLILLSTAFAFIHCAPETQKAPSASNEPPKATEAFKVQDAGPLKLDDRYQISISKKEGINKEFLLFASYLFLNPAATSHGTKGRIVRFKWEPNSRQVLLVESLRGLRVSKTLNGIPDTLASFKVLRETDDAFLIDFNAGMKRLYLMDGWQGSDLDSKEYDGLSQSLSFELSNAYISSAQVSEEALEVSQVGTANLLLFSPTLEVRYFLSPFQENPEFQKKENLDFKRMGYFEVPTSLEEGGRPIAHISRWDLKKKPIPYYVSANTPKEYVQAVKDGILYWNTVAGEEILRAEVAPDGITAPSANYNIVQWVEWDEAPMAYADALGDPLTGELRHAQIFLTSVFAVDSKARAAKLLRQQRAQTASKHAPFSFKRALLDIQENLNKNSKPDPVVDALVNKLLAKGISSSQEPLAPLLQALDRSSPYLEWFLKLDLLQKLQSGNLCKLDFRQKLANALEAPLAASLEDAAFLRISQDMVRNVVAHEVGHTLGLRHNFAGNLGATASIREEEKAYRNYLLKGETPDSDKMVFTSSVMDYLPFEVDVLTGSQFQNLKKGFAHDRLAFEWGYRDQMPKERGLEEGDAAPEAEEIPLFCTDSDLEDNWGDPLYVDCAQFDKGGNPLEYLAWQTSSTLDKLPMDFAELFIAAKAPSDPRDVKSFRSVSPNPDRIVNKITKQLSKKLNWFSENLKSLRFERQYQDLARLDNKAILNKRYDWVVSKISEMDEKNEKGEVVRDGLDLFLFSILPAADRPAPPLAAGFENALNDYLQRDDVINGVGWNGKRYRLTEPEIRWIREKGKVYFQKIEEKLLDKLLDELRNKNFEITPLLEKVAKRYSVISKTLILNEAGYADTHLVPSSGPVNLEDSKAPIQAVIRLMQFQYKRNVRVAAAALLKISLGSGDNRLLGWEDAVATELVRNLKELVFKTFGFDPTTFKNDEEFNKAFDKITEERIPEQDQKKWFAEQKAVIDALPKKGGSSSGSATPLFSPLYWWGFHPASEQRNQ